MRFNFGTQRCVIGLAARIPLKAPLRPVNSYFGRLCCLLTPFHARCSRLTKPKQLARVGTITSRCMPLSFSGRFELNIEELGKLGIIAYNLAYVPVTCLLIDSLEFW